VRKHQPGKLVGDNGIGVLADRGDNRTKLRGQHDQIGRYER
jgi:hypothetical protein